MMAETRTPGASFADQFTLRGGPGHRLLGARGLLEGGGLVALCVIVVTLAAVPLLLLAHAQGVAAGNRIQLPLLRDLTVYAVLFGAPWILVMGEMVNRRIRYAVRYFEAAALVPEARRRDFDESVTRTSRLADSGLSDVLLLVLAVALGWLDFRAVHAIPGHSSWHWIGGPGSLSWAGRWFSLVTLPLYHFLLLRWLWRLVLWTLWLRTVSKLDLDLLATHPDRAGGLGFLGDAQAAFNLMLVPVAVVFSARAASWIQYGGGSTDQLKYVLGAFVILAIVVVQGPLLVFTPLLVLARRRGILQYGALADAYVHDFHGKWVMGRKPPDEPLLGAADIQSLADMGNSLQVVRGMQLAPIGLSELAATALTAIVPMLPLLSTVIPLQDILKKVVELVAR
jgi:hypothetical protein